VSQDSLHPSMIESIRFGDGGVPSSIHDRVDSVTRSSFRCFNRYVILDSQVNFVVSPDQFIVENF
jgi:hypothetical protein